MKKRLGIALAILIALWLGAVVMNQFASPTMELGLKDGKLNQCPESPNCVCTYASDDVHAIAPIEYSGSEESAIAAAEAALSSLRGIKILESEGNYLRATATTLIMRYVDDVEVYVDDEAKQIHFRSASRVGYSDLGANRKRMENFRSAFENESEG